MEREKQIVNIKEKCQRLVKQKVSKSLFVADFSVVVLNFL